jgi:hypothetical protein
MFELAMSWEAANQVRVSEAQVVVIEPQVSPIETFEELLNEFVGLSWFIICCFLR